jgi:hypothetical protein
MERCSGILIFLPAVSRSCSGIAITVLKPMSTSQYAGQNIRKSMVLGLSIQLMVYLVMGFVCFGPDGELYVCDNQKDSKGRLLCITFKDDMIDRCEVVAYGLDNANGVKYLNGKLYLTQAFLYNVERGDGAASSGLYMFSASDRNVKVGNSPADPQCVFSDVTRNPQIRGGLNGVAVDAKGFIYTGNYGDGRVWKLTPGADGRIVKSEEILHAGGLSVTPDGMCVDAAGSLYIADMRGDALQRILPDGRVEFLRKGGFVRPSEPCVWNGAVYVANYGGTTLEVVPLCGSCCGR